MDPECGYISALVLITHVESLGGKNDVLPASCFLDGHSMNDAERLDFNFKDLPLKKCKFNDLSVMLHLFVQIIIHFLFLY